jgi:hypothetical protein
MRAQTATQAGEFTAALLHYGPGAHPGGSPQSVHGGGAEPARPPANARQSYNAELERFRGISARHREVTARYRAGQIGDSEFLTSRRELEQASNRLDVAERALQDAGDDDGGAEPARPPQPTAGQMALDLEATTPVTPERPPPTVVLKEKYRGGPQLHEHTVEQRSDGWRFAIWRRSTKSPNGIEIVGQGDGYATEGAAFVAKHRAASTLKARLRVEGEEQYATKTGTYETYYRFTFPNNETSESTGITYGLAGLNDDIAHFVDWEEQRGRQVTHIWTTRVK